VEYVRGSQYDYWHYCKNCTQYPIYIYQSTPMRPPSNICEQCETKDHNGNCQCEDIDTKKMDKPQLKREIPESCYASF
jgi:hypothetical protein